MSSILVYALLAFQFSLTVNAEPYSIHTAGAKAREWANQAARDEELSADEKVAIYDILFARAQFSLRYSRGTKYVTFGNPGLGFTESVLVEFEQSPPPQIIWVTTGNAVSAKRVLSILAKLGDDRTADIFFEKDSKEAILNRAQDSDLVVIENPAGDVEHVNGLIQELSEQLPRAASVVFLSAGDTTPEIKTEFEGQLAIVRHDFCATLLERP